MSLRRSGSYIVAADPGTTHLMSASTLRKLQQARERLNQGDLAGAAYVCDDLLRREPRNADALWLLGTIRLMTGEPALAAPLLERAVAAQPGNGPALENLGLARLLLGDHSAAEDALRRALRVANAPPSVAMRLGIALMRQEKHAEAIALLQQTVRTDPGNADARLNLGLAYGGAGEFAAAAQAFEQVLEMQPTNNDALFNLGLASVHQGDFERGRWCYERVLARAPKYMDAHDRLAAMYLASGRYAQALEHLQQIVEAEPGNAVALGGVANALFQLGRLEEAEQMAARARAADPAQSAPYNVLGQIHTVRSRFDAAATVLEEGYRRTGYRALLGGAMHLQHRMCDWPKWRASWRLIASELDTAADFGTPFGLLNEDTTAAQQLTYSRRWAAARFGTPPSATAPAIATAGEGRLRVGYFSSDFKEHAAAYLLAEVLELHDRDRFEIFAYSYGPDDASPMRARIRSAVEHFIDVAWDSDDVIAERMREDGLDVLVDLKGYTIGHRLPVMARRPCAAQVTWLGYPGTTGASFIDYIIADEDIVPAGAEANYSERVLRMPHCYQANDRKRPVGEARMRSEYGLPDDAFVFCCFNQAVKITPEIFERWMNLLQRVEGSVLWLAEDNRWASENLVEAARARGVNAARIVFTPRMKYADHLARYRVADLSLDTFPYTSHTTASDSLWVGCPLVALRGGTFAARVSASIVRNCNLPDLVTDSLEAYESLAFRLATERSYLDDVRARVIASRDAAPLFDSRTFTRDLEKLYVDIAGTGGSGE